MQTPFPAREVADLNFRDRLHRTDALRRKGSTDADDASAEPSKGAAADTCEFAVPGARTWREMPWRVGQVGEGGWSIPLGVGPFSLCICEPFRFEPRIQTLTWSLLQPGQDLREGQLEQ